MTDPDFIDMSPYVELALPPETERAWAAGFFDGEGWIGSSKAKGYTYLKMAVVQTGRRDTLERFNTAIADMGRIYERSRNTPENWADGWVLQVNSITRVVFAVNLLWPYLSPPKREQTVKAFATRNAYRSGWPADLKRSTQRLTPDDVREIRRLCAEGVLRQEIADRFGLHVTTVSHVKSGKLHGNVV